jgi:hypothetical protein
MLSPILAVGDTLPSFVLKNEKTEVVDVEILMNGREWAGAVLEAEG